MQQKPVFTSGTVKVYIADNETAMGEFTADYITAVLKEQYKQHKIPVLWLMAAPSGFAFYRALIQHAQKDQPLRNILRETHFFQFDDYPVARSSKRFPITFRALLENYLFHPLAEVCEDLEHVHLLELTGTEQDEEIQRAYKDALLTLREQNSYIVQLKGIGMDGHWGFHSAETPLDSEADLITVQMNEQNIHQQRIDWPDLFSTLEDVPKTACTFNVNMFLLADEIIDNVPQATKEYSVLATYGTEDIVQEVPSSALKQHKKARAYLTQQAVQALLEFRKGQSTDKNSTLSNATLERLKKLWVDSPTPQIALESIRKMEQVLKQLSMI